MIKVLFCQRVIPNYRAGVFRKFSTLPAISLTVSYWTDRIEDPTPHVSGGLGFATVAFTPLRQRFWGRGYWFNLDLLKYLVKKKPEVVIGPINMFGIHTVVSKIIEDLVVLLIGTKFIYRVSFGRWPGEIDSSPRSLRKIWYKWLFRNVVVTAYSQRAADVAKKRGCHPDRILVDFNSMDSEELLAIRTQLERTIDAWKTDFLQQYGIASEGYVLFVGRISHKKRLDVLIEAWKRVVQQVEIVQLVVVGSGPGREEAVQESAEISHRVVFVDGIYETKELAKFYDLAKIVVFPGYATLSTHFAMCFGKPIVTSQYGNEAEYVQHGVNGLVFEYGNEEDLSNCIIKLLKDRIARELYGEESKRIVREKININCMVRAWHSAAMLAHGEIATEQRRI